MKKFSLIDILITVVIFAALSIFALLYIVSEYEEIFNEQQKVIEIQRKIIKQYEHNEELPSLTNLEIKQA